MLWTTIALLNRVARKRQVLDRFKSECGPVIGPRRHTSDGRALRCGSTLKCAHRLTLTISAAVRETGVVTGQSVWFGRKCEQNHWEQRWLPIRFARLWAPSLLRRTPLWCCPLTKNSGRGSSASWSRWSPLREASRRWSRMTPFRRQQVSALFICTNALVIIPVRQREINLTTLINFTSKVCVLVRQYLHENIFFH